MVTDNATLPSKWYVYYNTLISRFMGPTWGLPGADRTQAAPCWPPDPYYMGMLSQACLQMFLSLNSNKIIDVSRGFVCNFEWDQLTIHDISAQCTNINAPLAECVRHLPNAIIQCLIDCCVSMTLSVNDTCIMVWKQCPVAKYITHRHQQSIFRLYLRAE